MDERITTTITEHAFHTSPHLEHTQEIASCPMQLFYALPAFQHPTLKSWLELGNEATQYHCIKKEITTYFH